MKSKLVFFSFLYFVFSSLSISPVLAKETEAFLFSEKYTVNSVPTDMVKIRVSSEGPFVPISEKESVQKMNIRLDNSVKSNRTKLEKIQGTKSIQANSVLLKIYDFAQKVVHEALHAIHNTYMQLSEWTTQIGNYSHTDLGFLASNIVLEKTKVLPEQKVLGLRNIQSDPVPDFLNILEKKDDGCEREHNSEKLYSASSAARLLATVLKIGPNGLYSQFQCDNPNSSFIPEKAKAIYKKSPTWFPHKSFLTKKITNDYLQCIAFVFMSYEMAGTPITKKGRTNADDLLADKYTGKNAQFNKFQSGHTTEMPKEGDVIVWSASSLKNQYGHVGIIVEVREDEFLTRLKARQSGHIQKPEKRFGIIRIANSNSSRVMHEYQYIVDEKTKVVSLEKVSKDWAKVPDYWLRLKSSSAGSSEHDSASSPSNGEVKK